MSVVSKVPAQGLTAGSLRVTMSGWEPPTGDTTSRLILLVDGLPDYPVLRVDAALTNSCATTLTQPLYRRGFEEDGEQVTALEEILQRWVISRLESMFAEGGAERLRADATGDSRGPVLRLLAAPDKAPLLLELFDQASCTYQLREGLGLWCAAASADDETVEVDDGVRRLAPTTTRVCAACGLPDDRVRCSAMTHPRVLGERRNHGVYERQVQFALCAEGRPEATTKSAGCRVGGHECWRRDLISAPTDMPVVTGPQLLEAFDTLDAYFRLAYGKRLVRVRSVHDAGVLAQPVTDRTEFKDRLSALADLLSNFDVKVLQTGDSGSLNALQTALQRDADADQNVIQAALSPLRSAVGLRASLQHTGKGIDTRDLDGLGLSWPLGDWTAAWAGGRDRVAWSMSELRRLLRDIADGKESETSPPS